MRTTKLFAVLLAVAVLFSAGCRRKKYENPITKDTEQPDKVLFDKSMKDVEKGRYEIARLTLNTLMNTYDTSEYLAKAKLLIADSWFREGGSHALAQAEAEYKDFILFYPTMEEAAESQMKICDIHMKQIEKPDRDDTHLIRADEECRQLLTQFPNSRFAPQAAQRLRNIQEVIAEREFRVGSYYSSRGAWVAATNRLQGMTDHYPLYSQADIGLMKLGDNYAKLPVRFKPQAASAYQRIVREYPLSPLVDEAKKKLKEMEAEIPEADPVAVARMKYEQENATPRGRFGQLMGAFAHGPDYSNAAKAGTPSMTSLRPGVPVSVPTPTSAEGGVSDVTVGTAEGGAAELAEKPDARLGQQNQAATEPAASSAGKQDGKAQKSKKESKKKK